MIAGTLNLHLERIVLDGLTLSPRERRVFEQALHTELTRLLTEGGLSPMLQSSSTIPALQVAPVVAVDRSPDALGAQVAQSIYGGLGDGSIR